VGTAGGRGDDWPTPPSWSCAYARPDISAGLDPAAHAPQCEHPLVDGSSVYGNDLEQQRFLREGTGGGYDWPAVCRRSRLTPPTIRPSCRASGWAWA